MKFRKAKKEDISKMFEILKINSPKYPKKLAMHELNEMFSKSLIKPTYIVAENKKEIIGFTIANYNPVFKKAIIENIFVHPNFRGQKVGKKLLDNLMAKLEQIGCEYVCILTESNNKNSIEFYQKMGFNRGINYAWLDKVLSDKFSKS